jgi:hypothetical protein
VVMIAEKAAALIRGDAVDRAHIQARPAASRW